MPKGTKGKGKGKGKDNSSFCSVCGIGMQSAIRNHYGGRVCYSCRAFFRRIVRLKGCPPLIDSCNRISEQVGECKFDESNRQLCGYCRYAKCKRIGMKEELVMSKEDIEEMKKKSILVKLTKIKSSQLPLTKYQSRVKQLSEMSGEPENTEKNESLSIIDNPQPSTSSETDFFKDFNFCSSDGALDTEAFETLMVPTQTSTEQSISGLDQAFSQFNDIDNILLEAIFDEIVQDLNSRQEDYVELILLCVPFKTTGVLKFMYPKESGNDDVQFIPLGTMKKEFVKLFEKQK